MIKYLVDSLKQCFYGFSFISFFLFPTVPQPQTQSFSNRSLTHFFLKPEALWMFTAVSSTIRKQWIHTQIIKKNFCIPSQYWHNQLCHFTTQIMYLHLYLSVNHFIITVFKESIKPGIQWQTSGKGFNFFIYTVKNPHGYRDCYNKA